MPWFWFGRDDYQRSQISFLCDHKVTDASAADGLIYSAIGARICYSKDSPVDVILKDKRVIDFEERKSYLKRLKGWHHYSVFAHSPIWAFQRPSCDDVSLRGSFPYKSFPIDQATTFSYILNARHSIELLGLDIEKLMDKNRPVKFYIIRTGIAGFEHKELTEDDAGEYIADEYIIASYLDIPFYGWLFVIAHGFSRVFTHQLVRHTWLNFSQRSFRYTETFGIQCPMSEDMHVFGRNYFYMLADIAEIPYRKLLERGYKKQDARYLYPMGARTTIAMSGPMLVFEDFIKKRTGKDAQHEIRFVARAIEYFINEVIMK